MKYIKVTAQCMLNLNLMTNKEYYATDTGKSCNQYPLECGKIYLIIYTVLAIAMQYTEAGYLLHSFRGKKMGHKLEAMVLQ